GVGNQALAQPYLDRMVALAAKQNGWTGVNGKYFTNRAAAAAFIKAETPHYGILSLPAFLALRGTHQLEVIGKVEVSLAGGRRYYLISKTADDLTGCKGRALATDHADDVRFIDTVVLGGAAKLADFTLVPTRRPLQTIRAVLTGQAVCALIDDAQKDQLDHLRSKDGVHTVWESAELPPMPVVAFPAAPEAERTTFKKKLDGVCEDDGKMACVEVGIDDLSGADAGDYATVVAAYGE
ncbi:MAG: PhnD/SsuA/transferrin family substrate-binding protein, partial [Gaiellaceae bacterium]